MADVVHQVSALIPKEHWDECYFSILSLKAHLQSLPGWRQMSVAGRPDDDTVDVEINTTWASAGVLEIWMNKGITPDNLIRAIVGPDADVPIETLLGVAI